MKRFHRILRPAVFVVIWTGCLLRAAPADEQVFEIDQLGSGDPVNQLLDRAGLSSDELRLPIPGLSLRLMSASPLRPPGLFYALSDEPLRTSWHLLHYRQRLVHAKEKLRKLIMYMTARMDVALYRGYHNNPWRALEEDLSHQHDPLLYFLEQAAETCGAHFTPAARQDALARLRTLPPSLHKPLATILAFCVSAKRWHNKAFDEWRTGPHRDEFFNLTRLPVFDSGASAEPYDLREFITRVDYAYLCAGAQDIAEGLDRALPELLKARPATTDTVRWGLNTPLGLILVDWGNDDNVYEAPRGQNVLLLVDYAGNDTYYTGAANDSTTQPISLLIDLSGDDVYMSRERFRPCFGAGVGGYGVLIDAAGDDRYLGGYFTQGAAFLGMGVLWDKSGDDSYASLQHSQAAAMGGLALLYDGGGNDRYHGYTEIQGFGSTRGFGLLMDDGGNDRYICADDRPFSPSPQAPGHNNSLGQGVGKGYRSDLTDGHSIPGGVGMLLDEDGDDLYSAAVMAQGVGFWSGVGILMDMKGNDQYSGLYYVQGVGIHSAAGALCDYDGNDTYTVKLYIAQGAGHDFSVGYFLDFSGDDYYKSPAMGMGTGNQNGIGIFLERSGNDRYDLPAPDQSQGRAKMSKWGTTGEDEWNVGLFLDLGGDDSYPDELGPRNDKFWIQKSQWTLSPRLKSEWGLGLDGRFDRLDTPLFPLTPYTPDD